MTSPAGEAALKARSHEPTREECLLGCIAHLALFGGFWLVGPLVIYYLKRGQSRFVAFHCVQAILLSLAAIAFGALAAVMILPGVMLATLLGEQLGRVSGMLLVALAWALGLGFAVLPAVLAFVAGSRAFRGRWWSVPVIGRWALGWLERPEQLPAGSSTPVEQRRGH